MNGFLNCCKKKLGVYISPKLKIHWMAFVFFRVCYMYMQTFLVITQISFIDCHVGLVGYSLSSNLKYSIKETNKIN